MAGYHGIDVLTTPEATEIRTAVEKWESAPSHERDFRAFEQQVRQATMRLERSVLARGLAAFDVDHDRIQVGEKQFKKLESPREGTYCCLAGEISVPRHLYTPAEGGRPICPLELRAGIVEGAWTPSAAEIMAHSAAVMTPYEAESLLPKFGGFSPSRSSLDRLPKALSKRWEENRVAWEAAIRESEAVPVGTAIVAVSLDGVTVPMKNGGRAKKREEARKQGKETRGPAGYREAGCGVVAMYDDYQERLQTIYYGRMPESKKSTLHEQLLSEASAVLSTVSCPILVLMSDGANDNWRILDDIVESMRKQGLLRPDDVVFRIADFYHASEHLKKATDLYYGQNSPKSFGAHEELRRILLKEGDGVEQVIKRLTYFRNQLPKGRRRDQLSTKVEYFRSRIDRMRYAEYQRLGLPIGTGVTEATCKVLVTQRMKRSGQRWAEGGGQAILTLRSLLRSGRWDTGWALISTSYRPRIAKVSQKGHLRVIEPLDAVA